MKINSKALYGASAIFLMLSITTINAQEQRFHRFGYLPFYRFHLVDSIDMTKLTHLCIAFANPTMSGRLTFNDQDISPVVNKAKAAGTDILLSLAGGGLEPVQKRAWKKWLLPWNRPKLIHEIMNWVRTHEFDGVDVDLEWGDVTEHYSGFVLELRDSLLEERKMLTASLPGTTRYKNLSNLALEAFDYVQVMAYDLTGPWAPKLMGQHAPFSMASQSIDFWKSQGVEPERLILGLPFYGWDFSNPNRTYSASYGFLVAKDTSLAMLDQFGDVYYNGRPLIEAKTQLALEQAGGVMFWEIGQDAFNKHSLIHAVNEMVNLHFARENKETIELDNIAKIRPGSLAPEQSDEKLFTLTIKDNRTVIQDGSTKAVIALPRHPTGTFVLEYLLKNRFLIKEQEVQRSASSASGAK